MGRYSTPERNRMSIDTLTALDSIHDDTINQFVNTKLKKKNNLSAEICLSFILTLGLKEICSKRYTECVAELDKLCPRLS